MSLAALNPQSSLDTSQIVFASAVAFVIGGIVSVLQTRSFPHTFLRTFGITQRPGEVDIWAYTFNSPDVDTWATVRHSNGKVYQGWVRGYSDGTDDRELVMVEVDVFVPGPDAAGEMVKVDQLPILYLGLDRKNIVIELRTTDIAEQQRTPIPEHQQTDIPQTGGDHAA
jgi:hypothetical protein